MLSQVDSDKSRHKITFTFSILIPYSLRSMEIGANFIAGAWSWCSPNSTSGGAKGGPREIVGSPANFGFSKDFPNVDWKVKNWQSSSVIKPQNMHHRQLKFTLTFFCIDFSYHPHFPGPPKKLAPPLNLTKKRYVEVHQALLISLSNLQL